MRRRNPRPRRIRCQLAEGELHQRGGRTGVPEVRLVVARRGPLRSPAPQRLRGPVQALPTRASRVPPRPRRPSRHAAVIDFDIDWKDAPGVRDPVLARTWCALTIRVRGEPVTRVSDRRTKGWRNSVYGSVFPLCRWLVDSFWSLLYEPYRWHIHYGSRDLARNSADRPWVRRHSLLAAREGGTLPDLTLFRDGDDVLARWLKDGGDATHPSLRFVQEGQARLPPDISATASKPSLTPSGTAPRTSSTPTSPSFGTIGAIFAPSPRTRPICALGRRVWASTPTTTTSSPTARRSGSEPPSKGSKNASPGTFWTLPRSRPLRVTSGGSRKHGAARSARIVRRAATRCRWPSPERATETRPRPTPPAIAARGRFAHTPAWTRTCCPTSPHCYASSAGRTNRWSQPKRPPRLACAQSSTMAVPVSRFSPRTRLGTRLPSASCSPDPCSCKPTPALRNAAW